MNLNSSFQSNQSSPMSLETNEELTTNNIIKNDERPEKYAGRMGDLRSIEEIYKSIVLSAPTGSGKTVVLELAIVRLLMKLEEINYHDDFKIVYMAPVKALCTERLMDWYGKFSKLGIPCIEITGDTDSLDAAQLKPYRIIMTTPEKWDSMTRCWKDNKFLVQVVKLFIIDEVHLLNEDVRGPVLEAVVSRMKTIQESITISNNCEKNTSSIANECTMSEWVDFDSIFEDHDKEEGRTNYLPIRFVAISATIPNAEDIAEWLGTRNHPAACYKISEEYRPVKLTKIVEGYPCKEGEGLFKFDFCLNYKLRAIIERYCGGKPTLIFCNTRKSVMMAAETLSKEILFEFSPVQKDKFSRMAAQLSEKKLQALVLSGIGCHHAGFTASNRNIIETMFRQGDLPVLITTSTLAMGVNLPAHLVIIKTTQHYVGGTYKEYEESTILQMMGRAGRPQFDTEGVAVIMTRNQDKERYERLCGGRRCVESALHRHLTEHLNAEAALGTLPDLVAAADWIRSTFLYVRAVKNPTHYGYRGCDRDRVEKKLEELCLKSMNALARVGLLTMDGDTRVTPTEAGYLMAAHCLDFETMKIILKVNGTETLSGLLCLVSQCHEFSDVVLRTSEKRCLNILNKNSKSPSCRFPLPGKIQTTSMKVNCLIQSIFGCLPIPDPSINQEATKIMRMGEHISKCIATYIARPNSVNSGQPIYRGVLNSTLLTKCFVARLWENSVFVSRQLTGIGPALATLLVNSNKTSFDIIRTSNPRDLERITKKLPPAGNILLKQVSLLPEYEISMKIDTGRMLSVRVAIKNYKNLLNGGSATTGDKHRFSIIVGDTENNLLLNDTMLDLHLLNHSNAEIIKRVAIKCPKTHTVFAHCLSNTWVGLDVQSQIKVKQSLMQEIPVALQQNIKKYLTNTQRSISNNNETGDGLVSNAVDDNYDIVEASQELQEHVIPKKRSKPNSNSKRNVPKAKAAETVPTSKTKNNKDIMEQINSFLNDIPLISSMKTLSSEGCYYKPLPTNLPNVEMEFAEPEIPITPSKILSDIQTSNKINRVASHHSTSTSEKLNFDNLLEENNTCFRNTNFKHPSSFENNSECDSLWNDIGDSYEDWVAKLAPPKVDSKVEKDTELNKMVYYDEIFNEHNDHISSNVPVDSMDNQMAKTKLILVGVNDSTINHVSKQLILPNETLSTDEAGYEQESPCMENYLKSGATIDLTSDSQSEDEKYLPSQSGVNLLRPYKHPYFGSIYQSIPDTVNSVDVPKFIDLTQISGEINTVYNPCEDITEEINDGVSCNKELSKIMYQYDDKVSNDNYCDSVFNEKCPTPLKSTSSDIATDTFCKLEQDAVAVKRSEKKSIYDEKSINDQKRRYVQLSITNFMKKKKSKFDDDIKLTMPLCEYTKPQMIMANNEISIIEKSINQPDNRISVNLKDQNCHLQSHTSLHNSIPRCLLDDEDVQNNLPYKKRYVTWSNPLILPSVDIDSDRIILQSRNGVHMNKPSSHIDLTINSLQNDNNDLNSKGLFVENIIDALDKNTGTRPSGSNITCNINVQINMNTTTCCRHTDDIFCSSKMKSHQREIGHSSLDCDDQSVPRVKNASNITQILTSPIEKILNIEEFVERDAKVDPRINILNMTQENNIKNCDAEKSMSIIEVIEHNPDIESKSYSDVKGWLQKSLYDADNGASVRDTLCIHNDISQSKDTLVESDQKEVLANENILKFTVENPFEHEITHLLKKHKKYQTFDSSKPGEGFLNTSWENEFEEDFVPTSNFKLNSNRKQQEYPKFSIKDVYKYKDDNVLKHYRYNQDVTISKSPSNTWKDLTYHQNIFKSSTRDSQIEPDEAHSPNIHSFKFENCIPTIESYNMQTPPLMTNLSPINYKDMMNPMTVLTLVYGSQDKSKSIRKNECIDLPEFDLSAEFYSDNDMYCQNIIPKELKPIYQENELPQNYCKKNLPEPNDSMTPHIFKSVNKSPPFDDHENKRPNFNQQSYFINDDTVCTTPKIDRWAEYLTSVSEDTGEINKMSMSASDKEITSRFCGPNLKSYSPRNLSTMNENESDILYPVNSLMEKYFFNMNSQMCHVKRKTESKTLSLKSLKMFERTPKHRL